MSVFLFRLMALLMSFFAASEACSFSFSEEEMKERQSAGPAMENIGSSISNACKERLQREKVMVLVAERGNNGFMTDQGRYGQLFQGIDRRLRKYGMRTMSPEEIRNQVAQAEIEAHFRNDPDAALQAAQKHGATLTLRGVINSRRSINPMLRINEVSVSMGFTLVAADGSSIAEAGAGSDSFSGSDTLSMAGTLINEQADGVVRRLVSGYCVGLTRK